jgi:two-component system nitrate/nitrite response regulator NarL
MRIVICDDHVLLTEAMAITFADHGHEVVATGTSPGEAEQLGRDHRPDVCLLDVNFPGGSSLDVISRVRATGTRVVMMSAWTEQDTVVRALGEGAAGYVSKRQPITEIVAALERAHAGEVGVDPALLRATGRAEADGGDPLWQLRFLTDREWEVMRCIMDGLTTAEMAARLGVRRSTARTHVQNLLTKLGVHSRLKAAALMTTHASSESWPAHLRQPVTPPAPPPGVGDAAAAGGVGATT